MERDVIDPDNGSFLIVDRFLRLWIRNLLNEAERQNKDFSENRVRSFLGATVWNGIVPPCTPY